MRALISGDVVISLQQVYAEGLLSGSKCVELRRRIPYLKTGTRVWFYSKVPVASVVGVGVLADIAIGRPDILWDMYSHCSGLKEAEFFRYFAGVEEGAALLFSSVSSLRDPIALSSLRDAEDSFHPPQFFRRVRSEALLKMLGDAVLEPWLYPCEHHSHGAVPGAPN